ncbi:hypothetical protein LOD99_8765 [Oopsacas minuta]|uniref:Secreted protein n=1 Tax=Oopsacas minuta TaxID=111878 RepID=A0AAV7JFH7_9METZ|nr:hypothetical protein LOD99_8765 [Oopsacas minuta]
MQYAYHHRLCGVSYPVYPVFLLMLVCISQPTVACTLGAFRCSSICFTCPFPFLMNPSFPLSTCQCNKSRLSYLSPEFLFTSNGAATNSSEQWSRCGSCTQTALPLFYLSYITSLQG